MVPKVLMYGQMIIAVLMIGGVLLQQRGGGLSSTFGGSSMEYSTKRGAEKIIFNATIVLAVLFVGVSIARLVL